MSHIFTGLSGVLCLMNDVFVFGKDNEQHNKQLTQIMKRMQGTGVTLQVCKNPVEIPWSHCI